MEVYKEDYELQKPFWTWEAINDWQKRIKGYTDEQKKFYNDMVPKIGELKNLIASDQGWEVLAESKKDDVIVETKRSIRGFYIMRANGMIDYPAKDIFRFICYTPMKPQWDLNNDQTVYKKKVGVNAYIVYSRTVKKFVISPRDFVVNLIQNTEADGTTYYCASSTDCEFEIPEVNNVIRG